MSTKSVAIQ